MSEKSWFWNRNAKRDELQKKAYLNKQDTPSNLPPAKDISSVSTRIKWFTKAIQSLSLKFSIDGGEGEVNFYLSIPWLFFFSIRLDYDGNAFKKKWPDLYRNDKDIQWGFNITRCYISLYWKYISNFESKSGFSWMRDWSDLIRGDFTDVTWEPSVKVLTTTRKITTRFRTEKYAEKGIKISPLPMDSRTVAIDVPITVYMKRGTWHYKRWFNIKRVRYEVASGVGIIVPGKGENSYDQEDEICKSTYDPLSGTASFSCAAKTPSLAADAYIESIKRKLNRS